jgi:hypothetical protein
MSFPISLPIKFYADGETPFNDNKPFGIIKKKYYQKYKLDSRIVHQYKDISELFLVMSITNEDGEEVKVINAVKELKNGFWFYSWDFTFAEQVLPAGCYRLSIYSSTIDGDVAMIAPIGLFAATGTVSAFVEIEGDMVITAPIGVFSATGTNGEWVLASAQFAYNIGDVCAAAPIDVYYTGPLGAGNFLFLQPEVGDFPVDGIYVIVDGGEIFNYNPSNGQIGLGTGTFC